MNLRVIERAQPEVEVQVVGHRHLGQVEGLWRIAHAAPDLLDVAQCTGAHQLDGGDELLAAALLATHLQDAVVSTHGTLYGQSLGDGIGQRLLQIDVLAGLERMDGHEGMPVVGRGNLDGIDILTLEHTLILFIDVATHRHALLLLPLGHIATEALALDAVHIAAGSHLHARTAREAAEVAASLLTQTDKAQDNAVAGCYAHTIHREARENHETSDASGGSRKEVAARHPFLGNRSLLYFLFHRILC